MGFFSPRQTDAAAMPLQSIFVPFPFVCFVLALVTDLAFFETANVMWQNFSAWLLFAGLVFGAVAPFAGLINLLRPRTRLLRAGFGSVLLYLIILALAVLNSLIQAGGGWTAVVPYGLALSALTFVLIVLTVGVSAGRYAKLAWRV